MHKKYIKNFYFHIKFICVKCFLIFPIIMELVRILWFCFRDQACPLRKAPLGCVLSFVCQGAVMVGRNSTISTLWFPEQSSRDNPPMRLKRLWLRLCLYWLHQAAIVRVA